jgi:diaminohydroxyphosphoribosylaminopyrimidine deaminase/5-amino-6-(5-phosphoribosylamino)uracil reductase
MKEQKENEQISLKQQEHFMRRCIELAQLGRASAAPNPMVGAVVVYQGKIIGEGWHRKCGEAHAEVNAIASVKDKSLLTKATIYVSLEPCAHFGKTPPCASLIIQHRIPHVVIGCTDSFSKVSGKGIEMLKKAGIAVTLNVLEQECRTLNKRFFCFHEKKRPYIILKWAQSEDGYLDTNRDVDSLQQAQPNWITGKTSKRLVHRWRSEESAILVGRKTAQNDNPSLTTRLWPGKNPTRILIDPHNKINGEYHLLDNSTSTIIINNTPHKELNNTNYIKTTEDQLDLGLLMHELHKKNILSLIVEGGRSTLQSFIDMKLWDEARVWTGPVLFEEGIPAPQLSHYAIVSKSKVNADNLVIYKNRP